MKATKVQEDLRLASEMLSYPEIGIDERLSVIEKIEAADKLINELIETIARLRRGESDLPEANRASQESGS